MAWSQIVAELSTELAEPISLDALTATWRIAQRVAGHRHSVDDVLTAYYALCEREIDKPGSAGRGSAPESERGVIDERRETAVADAAEIASAVRGASGPRQSGQTRVLDLGSGIGGVGLLALWGLGAAATLTCIEAQAISHRLLVANVTGNQLADRVTVRLGDLRELALPERFALVTGSPPYFPPGTGILPADSQKAHARFELRGDIGDYAHAAARHLEDDGTFVFCFPASQKDRALARVRDAGLHTTAWRDVIPRVGLRPLFTLFACRRAQRPCRIDPPLEVRHRDGSLSDEMFQVRRRFGFT